MRFKRVRLWLEADIHPHSDLRPLYPRKQTSRTRPYFFGFHSRASFWASDIWAGVIFSATRSRLKTASSRTLPGGDLEAARLYHIWAWA